MASSRYGLERAIFHPDVEVRAGPWRACMRELNYAGWKFEMEVGDYGRDTRIISRSPHSGMVCMLRGPTEMFKYQVSEGSLYFTEEVVLTNEHGVYKEVRVPVMPDAELLRVDVGSPIPASYGMEQEYRILTPYTNDEPQEIIVTPDKVPMLLEEIRKAQEPQARELLHRQRKRDGLERFKQEAKILSFS